MRRRTLLLAFCLLPLLFVGDGSARRRHGSCGSFCRQAGGLGGSPGTPPCRVLSRAIHAVDGVAPVRVRCYGKRVSRGVVALSPHDQRDGVSDGVPSGFYGGVDLVVRPGQTVTFQILLSRQTVRLLARRHSVAVDVLIELNAKPGVQANSWTRRLTNSASSPRR